MPGLHGGGVRYISEDVKILYVQKGERIFNAAEPGDDLFPAQLKLQLESAAAWRAREADGPALLLDLTSQGAQALPRDAEGDPDVDQVMFYQQIIPGIAPLGPTSGVLRRVADRLTRPARPGDLVSGKPVVPAAYTYFGQFLAHDLSHMTWNATINGWENAQNLHAFDLGSLFGLRVAETALNSVAHAGHDTWIGLDSGSRAADLPRSGADGTAVCTDRRSDSNLGLAQMTVLLMRFHQRAATQAGLSVTSTDQAKSLTRRHVQAVVLTDYLKRLIPDHVYNDVLDHGRKIVATDAAAPFEIPIEFAAACFRIGHSMVRSDYVPWLPDNVLPSFMKRDVSFEDLLDFTRDGGRLASGQLPRNYVQVWRHMAGNPQTPADEAVAAAGIDTSIANELAYVPRRLFEPRAGETLPNSLNLARRTLELGMTLGLPSGQTLYDHIQGEGVAMARAKADVRTFLYDRPSRFDSLYTDTALCTQTPLWLYSLIEAELEPGPCLGEVAGRVVMETFHAAIERAPDTILNPEPTGERILFTRQVHTQSGPQDEFSMADLVAVAAMPDQ